MKSGTLRKFSKVGVALSVSSVAFHLIAFTSDSWFVSKFKNSTYRVGVWYVNICDGNDVCKTVSKGENLSDRINNSYTVRWQMIMSIALLFSIICVAMFVVAIFRRTNDRRIRLVIVISSVLSGCLTVHELGITIRAIQSVMQLENYTLFFPWSLVGVFFAAFLNLSVACITLMLEWKMHQSRNHRLWQNLQQGDTQFNQLRKRTIQGIVFTAMSIEFQIIAYASNDWRTGKKYDTTTHLGLWFLKKCVKDDCNTMYNGFDYYYNLNVRSKIVLTLSLMLSCICSLLVLIEYRSIHSNRLIRLGIILSALLSGTFWLYDVAFYIRIYVIDMEYNTGSKITLFPWSLLFALLGTILILVFSFLCFVKELKVMDIDYADVTNNLAINLLEINTNAENALIENSGNIYADEH